jgi:hypothetical protein
MRPDLLQARVTNNHRSAFTLAEVVIALVIIATIFGGMVVAYIQATRRAQWSGYSLAARALSVQQLEQARSADWDPSFGQRNEILSLNLINANTNFSGGGSLTTFYTYTGYSWTNLDLPTSGNNFIRATNYVTIKMFYANGASTPPIRLQMIRVDTVWPFTWSGQTTYFTNSIATYEAPDNSQQY